MFKHLFKLIWNKKKQNFLLITEMLISFMVIFAVFSLIVNFYHNYKLPRGFDYENVWVINYSPPERVQNTDSIGSKHEMVIKTIKSFAQVEEASFSQGNVPFAMNQGMTFLKYNQREEKSNAYSTEANYNKTLNMKLVEGRWFDKSDTVNKGNPVVINEMLKEKLFGTSNAIGKIIKSGEDKLRVVGIVTNLKDKGDYSSIESGAFFPMGKDSYDSNSTIVVRVKSSADAVFEGKLFKAVSGILKNSTIEIVHMSKMRTSKNNFTLIPMIILFVVAAFLIINVALGLFGVLWYNINKRKGEIGLRRAIGASGKSVAYQLVGETVILATFSLIIGSFFAIQFPLLNVFDLPASVYLIALFFAILFIYLLVIICSVYPGRQAAAIYPAIALHEE